MRQLDPDLTRQQLHVAVHSSATTEFTVCPNEITHAKGKGQGQRKEKRKNSARNPTKGQTRRRRSAEIQKKKQAHARWRLGASRPTCPALTGRLLLPRPAHWIQGALAIHGSVRKIRSGHDQPDSPPPRPIAPLCATLQHDSFHTAAPSSLHCASWPVVGFENKRQSIERK